MIPTETRGATNLFTAPKNWDPDTEGPCGDLQVRIECFGERQVVEMISTWKPTPRELEHLNAGGVIEIGLTQQTQPAMRAYVVDPIEKALLPYVVPQATEPSVKREDRPITINEHAHGDDYNGTHAYPDEL